MTEEPFDALLHRDLQRHDVREHFSPQLALLRDVVNYGTNIIPSAFASSERKLADIVVISILLKQLVSMLDAFEVLISNACVPASLIQSRAAFEASIYIDFILAGDGERKAQHYYVANVRRQIEWARRTQEGNPSRTRFFQALGEFADVLRATKEKIEQPARIQLAEAEAHLKQEPWSTVNASIETARGKRPFDPPWYAPSGYQTVGALSNAVKRRHEYEVFYSAGSEQMHGSDYKSHIKIEDGHITMHPIRHLAGIGNVVTFTLSVALHTYRKVLERYRAGQIAQLNRYYLTHWREPFLSMKDVQYTTEEDKVII